MQLLTTYMHPIIARNIVHHSTYYMNYIYFGMIIILLFIVVILEDVIDGSKYETLKADPMHLKWGERDKEREG